MIITTIAVVITFIAFLYAMRQEDYIIAMINLVLCLANIIIWVENGY